MAPLALSPPLSLRLRLLAPARRVPGEHLEDEGEGDEQHQDQAPHRHREDGHVRPHVDGDALGEAGGRVDTGQLCAVGQLSECIF